MSEVEHKTKTRVRASGWVGLSAESLEQHEQCAMTRIALRLGAKEEND